MWKILLENGNKKHIFWSGGEDRRTLSSAQWGVTMAVLPRWGVQRTEDRGHCPGSQQIIFSCLHLAHLAAHHAFSLLLKENICQNENEHKRLLLHVKCFASTDSSVWTWDQVCSLTSRVPTANIPQEQRINSNQTVCGEWEWRVWVMLGGVLLSSTLHVNHSKHSTQTTLILS